MVYFKEMSVFFVLCVFVGSSFATPAPKFMREQSTDNSLFPKNFQQSIKHYTHEVEKSFSGFTKNFEFMFKNLNGVFQSTVEKGFENVAVWAVDIMGRVEFLVMADGSHFMTPVSGKSEMEQEYKTVAIAVSKLLRNLKTMERTDKLITNATRKVVTEDFDSQINEIKTSPEKAFRTILHSYIEAMDHLFENDAELATEYAKEKTEAKQYVRRDSKMREPLLKLWDEHVKYPNEQETKSFFQDKKVVREAYANKLFLKQAVKHLAMIFNSKDQTRYYVARALIQKAQSSAYESKVNEVYHKALARAGAIEYMYETDDVITDVLFHSIDKELESDKALHKEIEGAMKSVQATTDYDFGLFHIDFAPF